MEKTKSRICLYIISCLFLTGCWDVTEIEEIGFLLALGLDPTINEPNQLEQLEKELGKEIPRKTEHDQLFSTTFNIAIPSNIKIQEGGSQRAYFNVTTSGLTNFKSIRRITSRNSRKVNFDHLKAIIINQELVRDRPMLEHLADFFIRDHEMRRRANVYISSDDTKEILNLKLPLEEMISVSIKEINENHNATFNMLRPTSIGEISTYISADHSFLIPRIVKRKNDLIIAGAAIFLGKENVMIGWLGEEDIHGYKWILGEADNVVIEVDYEEDKGEYFAYEVTSLRSNIEYERKDNKNIFHINVKTEGILGESWLHHVEISDVEELRKLERRTEERIKQTIERITNKMQNEFHADIFGFYNKVRRKDYPYWKSIKNHWDSEEGIFQHAEININVNVAIRHYMLNERLE